MDPKKVLILSTGSQGEELAALTRMAAGVHRDVKLKKEDTIVFSSSPIPGNEMAIVSVQNNLAEIGCTTIDNKDMDVYVSGHGYAEECKIMTSLLNPKYFAPIHGELYMRHGHRDMVVESLGIPQDRTFIMKNGQGIILSPKGARLMTEKEAIPAANVLVELGEAIHEHVLADRHLMADSGAIMIHIAHTKGSIKKFTLRARGFRYMHMEHDIYKLVEKELRTAFERNFSPEKPIKALENMLATTAQRTFLQKTKSEPLVEVVVG